MIGHSHEIMGNTVAVVASEDFMGAFGVGESMAVPTRRNFSMFAVAETAGQVMMLGCVGFQQRGSPGMTGHAMSRCCLSLGPGQRLMNLMAGLAVLFPFMAGRTIDHARMGTFLVTVATRGNAGCRHWAMTLMAFQAAHLLLVGHASGSNQLIFMGMALAAIPNRQSRRSLCRFRDRTGQNLQKD